MKNITILVNYKGNFETKHKPTIYEGGMDLEIIKKTFEQYNYKPKLLRLFDLEFNKSYKDDIFIYTSSEDIDSFYKDYIEDVILMLTLNGATVIPGFEFLRAHNNKVFMELLGEKYKDTVLKSFSFGTIEDLQLFLGENSVNYPLVVKAAKGAVSSGVKLARNKKELINKAKILSNSKNVKNDVIDLIRSFRHKNYVLESRYRRKFLIQEFIPNLKNDWKIYFFGNRLYIWFRYVRKNDFRASGSGLFEFNEQVPIPEGLLDFAHKIYKTYNVPFISLDIAFDDKKFYLIEKQFLFFGKNGHYYSKYYYQKINDNWQKIDNEFPIEKVYVKSIIEYIEQQ